MTILTDDDRLGIALELLGKRELDEYRTKCEAREIEIIAEVQEEIALEQEKENTKGVQKDVGTDQE